MLVSGGSANVSTPHPTCSPDSVLGAADVDVGPVSPPNRKEELRMVSPLHVAAVVPVRVQPRVMELGGC